MELHSKEMAESIIKSLFALVPGAGQALNEAFYDYRGRVKQNRLNDFSALLIEYFQKHTEVNLTELNWLEFGDLFESVVLRVVRTGSRQKHARFRDILTNYISTLL